MYNRHKRYRLFEPKVKQRLEIYFVILQIFLIVLQVFALIKA